MDKDKRMDKEKVTNFFKREDVMVVLTTSPAGLGHIRVTEALKRGLPKGVRAEILGIEDKRIQFLHRITSRNRILRNLMEFVQSSPKIEKIFTRVYQNYLRRDTSYVFSQISSYVARRRPKPNVLLIISTHYSLAHKIAEVKGKLAKELELCVILCVVVTDDSPQKIWGVYGADYIFVPGNKTKIGLASYINSLKLPAPEIIVSPYPISPIFSKALSYEEFELRKSQVKPKESLTMKVIIPVSGAAVQLSYFKELISYLNKKNWFQITLVSRDSPFTRDFLGWCQGILSVEVMADKFDREVVASYEREIEQQVFAIEVTKPSEQAFKALASPKQRGGVILLFSETVGRQENDNLSFLTKHGLLPNEEDSKILDGLFYSNDREEITEAFLEKARTWKGILLPKNGKAAGVAISRLLKSGVLHLMVNFKGFRDSPEIGSDGVKRFWGKLARHTYTQCSPLGSSSLITDLVGQALLFPKGQALLISTLWFLCATELFCNAYNTF